MSGDALGQAVPSVPAPSVSVVPAPTASPAPSVPKVEAPSVPTKPPVREAPKAPMPAPSVEAPAPEAPRTPSPKAPGQAPSTPKTPPVPGNTPRVEAPSAPGGSDGPTRRAVPRVDAPRIDSPDAAAERVSPGGESASGGNGAGDAADGAAGASGGSTTPGPSPAPRGLLEVLGVTRSSDNRDGRGLSASLERSDSFPRTASQRRLRRLLERNSGCLSQLPAVRRRLVLLRVGADGRPPLSRRQVARRLGVPVTRVVREERGAVNTLRERAGRCSGGENEGAGAALGGGSGATGAAGVSASAAARGLGALLGGDIGAVRSAAAGEGEVASARQQGSDAPSEAPAGGGARTVATPFGVFDPASRDSVAVVSLFALLAALTAVLLTRAARRQWRIW